MTEDTLDKLRAHAARMHDEASRLVRALKPSNASEEQVREHLGHIEDAARKCRADGWPAPVDVVAIDRNHEAAVASVQEQRIAPTVTKRSRGR